MSAVADTTPAEKATEPTAKQPANGAQIRIAYFTTNEHSYPDAIHESALVLPGAVRGRNIKLSVSSGSVGEWQQVYGAQTFTLDASFDITPERELDNDEIIGFTVNGTDCTGTLTIHAKDKNAFFNLMQLFTGVNTSEEVVGWLNLHTLRIKLEILNPTNPGTVIKTLYVSDARFDIPATAARVNTVVDFSLNWESIVGTYSAFKGAASGI